MNLYSELQKAIEKQGRYFSSKEEWIEASIDSIIEHFTELKKSYKGLLNTTPNGETNG